MISNGMTSQMLSKPLAHAAPAMNKSESPGNRGITIRPVSVKMIRNRMKGKEDRGPKITKKD